VATTPALRWLDGELPNGVQFTYRTRTEFEETPRVWGPYSDSVTETAVNEAPVALGDNYNTTTAGITIAVSNGVLANDTDVDSAASSIKAVLVSGPTKGTLALNADGSFTYTPATGNPAGAVDSFTYKANNGVWSADPGVPMSGDSNVVTVTITITNH
jgi:large repetitive protein